MRRHRSIEIRKVKVPKQCRIIVIVLSALTVMILTAIILMEIIHALETLEDLKDFKQVDDHLNGTSNSLNIVENHGKHDGNTKKSIRPITIWLIVALLVCGSVTVVWIICLSKEMCQNSECCQMYCCTEVDYTKNSNNYKVKHFLKDIKTFESMETQAKRPNVPDNEYVNIISNNSSLNLYDNVGFSWPGHRIIERQKSEHFYHIINDDLISDQLKKDIIHDRSTLHSNSSPSLLFSNQSSDKTGHENKAVGNGTLLQMPISNAVSSMIDDKSKTPKEESSMHKLLSNSLSGTADNQSKVITTSSGMTDNGTKNAEVIADYTSCKEYISDDNYCSRL